MTEMFEKREKCARDIILCALQISKKEKRSPNRSDRYFLCRLKIFLNVKYQNKILVQDMFLAFNVK